MTVSVIIPSYNSAHCIQRAIQSVLNQTYRNFEIIVVDDGSTDTTRELVTAYADSRIRYIFQRNGGVSAARNRGIHEASGELVAFLDADDVWFNDKLAVQIECMKQIPQASLVFSDFSASNYKKTTIVSYSYQAFNFFNEYKYGLSNIFLNRETVRSYGGDVEVHWGDVFEYLVFGNFILPSTVLMKKDVITVVGLFNEKYRVAEETEFFLKVAKNHVLAYVNKPLTLYCLPDSTHLSGKNNTEQLIRNNIEILSNHLSQSNPGTQVAKVRKAMGRCYYRLSYYYLSVLECKNARASGVQAIHFDSVQWRAYLIFFLSFLPNSMIRILGHSKSRLMGRWSRYAK